MVINRVDGNKQRGEGRIASLLNGDINANFRDV